jgi:hypothetical protein
MTPETPIIYEKTDQSENALVIQVGDLESPNCLDPAQRIITSMGLSVEEFRQLVSGGLKPLEGPERFEVFNDEGDKIEDVVSWTVATSVGVAEVADIKLYPAVVGDEDNTSLHLQVGQTGGFELIYGISDKARLTFPKGVDPVAVGVYVSSRERTEVELFAGTLAIIPAPTANAWTQVGKDFKFRYICRPPWSSDFVVSVLDQ